MQKFRDRDHQTLEAYVGDQMMQVLKLSERFERVLTPAHSYNFHDVKDSKFHDTAERMTYDLLQDLKGTRYENASVFAVVPRIFKDADRETGDTIVRVFAEIYYDKTTTGEA